MSRPEATRTMNILKEASSQEGCFNQSIHILLSRESTGDLELVDSNTNSIISSYPVKTIRFCCRGTEELIKDCFAFTIKQPFSEGNESFQCHVIQVYTRCAMDTDNYSRITFIYLEFPTKYAWY